MFFSRISLCVADYRTLRILGSTYKCNPPEINGTTHVNKDCRIVVTATIKCIGYICSFNTIYKTRAQ